MERFLGALKVLVLVVGVMVVSGCAGYHRVDISPLDSQPLVRTGEEIKVYVEPHEFDVCTRSLIPIRAIPFNFCDSGEMSGYIIPALAANNIRIGSKDDHNVIVRTSEINFTNASQGLKATTKFLINGYTVEIVTTIYGGFGNNLGGGDAPNAFTVKGKILSKLIKNNIGGNHEIKAKVRQKDDKIVEWNDSTGL